MMCINSMPKYQIAGKRLYSILFPVLPVKERSCDPDGTATEGRNPHQPGSLNHHKEDTYSWGLPGPTEISGT